jgi:hypothetical protein
MIGRLVRSAAIFPIPPSYAGRATATFIATVAIMLLADIRSFPCVLAAAAAAGAVVFTGAAVRNRRRAA